LYPQGELPELPPEVRTQALPASRHGWQRLRYDQATLPRAAAELGADLLLILGEGIPLAARLPIVAVTPLEPTSSSAGVLESLRRAAGRAGARGASATLCPADVLSSAGNAEAYPPFVSNGFRHQEGKSPDSIQEYVLCYDTDPENVRKALAAWTWVDGALGDTYPLLFLGCDSDTERQILEVAAELNVLDSVTIRSKVSELPNIYHRAAAFLSVGLAAWGQPFRWALAAEVPVAAFETRPASSIMGEAAYLVPQGDTRALGAACLSLLVQEELADSLRAKGRKRAEAYRGGPPIQQLIEILKRTAAK